MKFSSISDLHIRHQGDNPSLLLESFVSTKEVKDSDTIFFLGDIFDFMVGNRTQYLEKYNYFFNIILKLINSGKQVIYIEGNHDFHLERIMNKFVEVNNLNSNQFQHFKESITKEIENKKFFFSHGHEVDENQSYQKWKNIYSSKPFKIFVDHFLPYSLVEKLGNKASKDSKKRGVKTFIYEKSQEKYRRGAKALIDNQKIDFLITGHTHIEENLKIGSSVYANNGFPQETNKFIHFDGEAVSLIEIS